jgi:ABC-type phosphate transport system substrate-binding protein
VISKKVVALCATVGVAVSGFAFSIPATAEPVSNSFTIVGSDTLEDVVSAIANGSSLGGATVRATAAGASIGSFDATGSSTIITEPYGIRFARPNGSSDGKLALSRSIDGAPYSSLTLTTVLPLTVITDQVDISRSSSAAAENTNGVLWQVPFGRDAFTYAYDSRNTAAGIATISDTDMNLLFLCDAATLAKFGGVTPVIPQAGSGTRKDFIGKLSITETQLQTVSEGGCVKEGQEHDASTLGQLEIMPMSASRWVAMNTGASFAKFTGTTVVGSLVAGQAAVSNAGTSMVPNATYYASTKWGRDVVLLVEFARVDPTNTAKYDSALAQLIDPSRAASLANITFTGVTKAGTLKGKFGFVAPVGTTAYRVSGS